MDGMVRWMGWDGEEAGRREGGKRGTKAREGVQTCKRTHPNCVETNTPPISPASLSTLFTSSSMLPCHGITRDGCCGGGGVESEIGLGVAWMALCERHTV